MPEYDFRCQNCKHEFTQFYKTYADYDNATPTCDSCGSADLSRLITGVHIGKSRSDHNYKDMSVNQMLSVLEGGDPKAVGEMMKQVGEGTPKSQLGEDYTNAAEALSRGVSAEQVEKDLDARALGPASDAPLPKPEKPP
jgi:putative FmdB family regulatory protein